MSLPDRLLRAFGVPPDLAPTWFEAFAPLQFASYPLLDDTGRALGEANVEPELRPPVEERACPYPDDRKGRPMNVTALGLVLEDWGWILRAVRAARTREGGGPSDGLTLWSFAAALGALPIGLVRSGRAPADAVPRRVASLFKVIQGVFMVAWAELPPGPLDLDAWMRALERRRVLHGRSGRVCGGPTRRIEELLEACLAPTEDGDVDLPLDALLPYGRAYAAMSLEKYALGARDARAVAELRRAGRRPPKGPVPDLDPRVLGLVEARLGVTPPGGDVVEGWITAQDAAEARITELQRAACRAVGAPAPAGPFRRTMIPGQADLARAARGVADR